VGIVTGRIATVGLILGCEQPGACTAKVVVRQGDAVAVGRQQGRCTGDPETHEVTVKTRNGPALAFGAAEICGDAATRVRGTVDETRSWCRAGGMTLEARHT
jgi:hypothetical protein